MMAFALPAQTMPQVDMGNLMAAFPGVALPVPVPGAAPVGSPLGEMLMPPSYGDVPGGTTMPAQAAVKPTAKSKAAPQFAPQPAPQVRQTSAASPVMTPTPAGMPTSAPGLNFGIGDIFNMFAHPVQGGLGTGILGLLGGLGNFMTNPANQYMMGSMLGAGAPQGTWPQMMGQNFAGQAGNILNWQALGSLLGGGNGQPQVGGMQPQAGGQPNFPNSNGPAAASPFASAIMSGAVNPAILTQAANIGAQQQETQQRARQVALAEQAAPFENLTRLFSAWSQSPQAMDKKQALQKELVRLNAQYSPHYDFREVSDGDNYKLIAFDTYTGKPAGPPLYSGRKTPETKQIIEEMKLRQEFSQLRIQPFTNSSAQAKAYVNAAMGDQMVADPKMAQNLYIDMYNKFLELQGVPLGNGPFNQAGGTTSSPASAYLPKKE